MRTTSLQTTVDRPVDQSHFKCTGIWPQSQFECHKKIASLGQRIGISHSGGLGNEYKSTPVHVKSLPAHAIRSLIIARKKLVGQRVTLENQIRGLAVVFGVRLPRGLTPAFIEQALKASEGVAGLSAAMRGLAAARAAVLAAVVAIDADMKRMVRASEACRRLMTIPGVGQLTALAFTAAIDDPGRFRRSRDLGAYLGLVPRRYQSGEVDYTGSISKCGDRRVRTLLYEAANVMLTRYKGKLKLKDWAFAIAKRSTMRKARIALARRLAIIMHAMLRDGTEFEPA
jgi:transposase